MTKYDRKVQKRKEEKEKEKKEERNYPLNELRSQEIVTFCILYYLVYRISMVVAENETISEH